MKIIILKILVWYKKYFSKGEHCRFIPSCSEYAYLAVKKYGVIKGGLKAVRRLLRCNPWNKGGVDLLQ